MTVTCELPDRNPPDDEIVELLTKSKTIAIVGCSPKPERDSHQVAKYLKEHGYKIIPVRPAVKEILGEKCYPDLKSIPEPVDIVDIFRKPEAIPPICEEAVEIGAKAVWMQLGLASSKGAKIARDAGLQVVQSKCIKIEHQRLGLK